MNATSTVEVKTDNVKGNHWTKITPTVERIVIFNFIYLVSIKKLNLRLLTAEIKNEKNEIIDFGVNPIKLQELINYLRAEEKPEISKKELTLNFYKYFVYLTVKGVSILNWLDKISPEAFKGIFEKTSKPEKVLSQLLNLKISIDDVLKSNKFMGPPFATKIHAIAVGFQNEYPEVADKFDIKMFSMADLGEFVECLYQDSSLFTKSKAAGE